MAYDTRELAVKITGDVTDYVKSNSQVQSETEKSKSALSSFADGSKKAAVALGVVGAGLTAYAKSATDSTTDFYKSSKTLATQTGTTIEQASQLIAITQQVGISSSQASTMFGAFAKQITAATDDAKNASQTQAELQNKIDKTKLEIQQATAEIAKNGDKTGELSLKVKTLNTNLSGLQGQLTSSQDAFQKLGINVLDAQGHTKGFDDLLLEVSDKFKGMQNGTEKTTLALELFGKSGKSLLPILNQGSDGIKDLEAKAQSLGITLTAQNVTTISKYIQSQKDLQNSTQALKLQVGELTAPVLTSFNQHINQISTAMISLHNPFHTVIIDVLAFGGPIAAASSAVLGFTSNLATTIQALGGFKLALGALSSFMLGPWGLAIAGVTLGLTVLVSHFMNNKSAAQQLADTTRQLKIDTDALKVSQDALAQSQLSEEQAALSVQQAQESYNAAVQQYGPDSLQAKQAMLDLRQAQLDLKQAHQDTISKMDEYRAKEDEVAKDQSLLNHLRDLQDNLSTVGRNAFDAGQKIETLNGARVEVKTSKNATGTDVIDFKSTFGGGLPHNASGTDSWTGGPTWVGENGPEIVVPPKGSQIVPNKQSQQLAGQPGSIVNLTVNVGMYAGMPVEKRQISLELYKELVRAARSQGVSLPMIGAVGVQ